VVRCSFLVLEAAGTARRAVLLLEGWGGLLAGEGGSWAKRIRDSSSRKNSYELLLLN